MQRRQFNQSLASAVALLVLAAQHRAWALSLNDLTEKEATCGLKTALEKGALAAIGLLGKHDGFLGNPAVRIPLPGYLEDAAQLLRKFGLGRRVDELVISMNRAAEAAMPLGKDLLVGAVKNMSVTDARNILSGGGNSVTQFFAEKTRLPLGEKFLPVVTKATEKVGLAAKYNKVAGKASGLGMLKKENASIQQYVTRKALDGLYTVVGEEERNMRQDPIGTGSAILMKVFGPLK